MPQGSFRCLEAGIGQRLAENRTSHEKGQVPKHLPFCFEAKRLLLGFFFLHFFLGGAGGRLGGLGLLGGAGGRLGGFSLHGGSTRVRSGLGTGNGESGKDQGGQELVHVNLSWYE